MNDPLTLCERDGGMNWSCLDRNACDSAALKVSLLGHRLRPFGDIAAIFIDFLGFRVYLGFNRTRHASRRCAPGGSFFALFSKRYVLSVQ